MSFNYPKYSRAFAVALVLMEVMMPVATAKEHHGEGGKYATAATNAKWKSECSACHIAYPPRLLPASSWREMMSGLDKHFGSDASLDAASASEITGFLVQNAGSESFVSWGKPVLRITETRWFKHEHDEVSQRDWNNPKVKRPSNCSACHTGADRGNFSEDDVRVPK